MSSKVLDPNNSSIDAKSTAETAAANAEFHPANTFTRMREHRLVVGVFASEVYDDFDRVIRKACKRSKVKLLAVVARSHQGRIKVAFVIKDDFETEREAHREMTRLLDELDEYYSSPK
jgi:hypothetical protein